AGEEQCGLDAETTLRSLRSEMDRVVQQQALVRLHPFDGRGERTRDHALPGLPLAVSILVDHRRLLQEAVAELGREGTEQRAEGQELDAQGITGPEEVAVRAQGDVAVLPLRLRGRREEGESHAGQEPLLDGHACLLVAGSSAVSNECSRPWCLETGLR